MGVDFDVFLGYLDLDSISVVGKMKWVVKWCMIWIEDMVYCLMGLFNVNMFLFYGEGGCVFMWL